ncbi:hypothetical protein XENOCAPTIV_002485 [Xenoophorus captivus]|uniref:Uncharacterized protein n=1 Tax=Xenoophorus captivus TaxID=1517983 RepID=A0ABV0QQF8_9TELE
MLVRGIMGLGIMLGCEDWPASSSDHSARKLTLSWPVTPELGQEKQAKSNTIMPCFSPSLGGANFVLSE